MRTTGATSSITSGGGGSVPKLLAALHIREARRRELLARREARSPEPIDPQAVRADLQQRLLEWRSLIQDRGNTAAGC